MKYGEIIDGRYKIEGLAGKGAMADVYLVRNIKLDSEWAMKRISKDSRLKTDYRKELEFLRRLNHHALPRIFDYFEDNDYMYLIIDFFNGENLYYYIRKKRFTEKEALDITRQLCDVLIYLHEQKPSPVIYRDLKPSNIMLTDDGRVKLIDFGIAREFKEEKEDDTVNIGTKGYAAPEQYGFGQTDTRTDIYALGIIFFQLLSGEITGRKGFEITGENMSLKSIPREIQRIIKKSTAQRPELRYERARDLLFDLNDLDAKKVKTAGIVRKVMVPPKDYKKVILIAGEDGVGRSTIIKGLSEYYSSKKKRVAVIDITAENILYRKIGIRYDMFSINETGNARESLASLQKGKAEAVIIDKRTRLFISGSRLDIDENEALNMLNILKTNSEIIVVLADMSANNAFLRHMDSIYIVKDMSPYTCYKYQNFLAEYVENRDYAEKIRFIINKHIKTTVKSRDIINTCCGEVLSYEDIRYFEIPFDTTNYRASIENERQGSFCCFNFTKQYKKSVAEIAGDIYRVSV